MSQVILFENDEPKTIFAPVYKWYMYEGEVKVRDIRDTILSKEKEVINSHHYESDWNTGLGKDSMTSRSNCYNLLRWDEADFLKETIRTAHDNFITSLTSFTNVIFKSFKTFWGISSKSLLLLNGAIICFKPAL